MSTINKMTTINRRDNTTSSTDAATEISLLEPIDALESSNPFYKVDVVIKLDSSTTLTAGLNQAEVNLTTYISYNILIKRYKEFADILQSTMAWTQWEQTMILQHSTMLLTNIIHEIFQKRSDK